MAFRKLFAYEGMSDRCLKERINAAVESKDSKIFAASKLSQWFEIELTIKIFGVTIVKFNFPPTEDSKSNEK